MIADHDSITRMELREMLKAEGYQVLKECRNGEDAIEQCLKLKPDLIIMDVKMPILNGVKAAKIIRKQLDIAILLLTESSQGELIEEVNESEVTAYLVKPVAKVDLIPAIEIALSQKRQFEWLSRDLQFLIQKTKDRSLIEKAKERVMESLLVPEEVAYQWMRKYSMNNRIALVVVADIILKQQVDILVRG
jgi:response regulator NasT